jgi:hypothetical protein
MSMGALTHWRPITRYQSFMAILKRLGSYALVLSLAGAAVSFAEAQTYSGSVDLDAGINATTTGNGTNVLQRSQTSIDAGKASPSASATGSANANINSRVQSENSSLNTRNGNTSTTSERDVFTIDRRDLRETDISVYDAAEVSTEDDFSAYARSIMQADENIIKVESSEAAVSIWYREPAKFLGIIPVMVTTQATVEADGTVAISHPWWYKMFVKDESAADLEDSLTSTAGTIAQAEGSVSLSTSAQARLLNALRAGMQAYHEANVSSGTSTDASTY